MNCNCGHKESLHFTTRIEVKGELNLPKRCALCLCQSYTENIMSEKLTKKQKAVEIMKVYLEPQNEGQDLNYQERFTGTPFQILEKSRKMIAGLNATLTQGSFSVKVVQYTGGGTNEVTIFADRIIDSNGETISQMF